MLWEERRAAQGEMIISSFFTTDAIFDIRAFGVSDIFPLLKLVGVRVTVQTVKKVSFLKG